MTEVVRRWLEVQLGFFFKSVTWEEDRGGKIVATLLHSLQLISSDQLRIIVNQTSELYEQTLEVMRVILVNLGIDLPKKTFQDMLYGRESAITKLLYELYLGQQEKDELHWLIAKKFQESSMQKGRFFVKKVDEDEFQDIDVQKFNNPLGEPIKASKNIIKFYIERYMAIVNKCNECRQAYTENFKERQSLNSFRNKESIAFEDEPQKPFLDVPEDVSIKELTGQNCIPDERVSYKIMEQIKEKGRKAEENKQIRKLYVQNTLRCIWNKMMDNQDEYFNEEFNNLLNRQSLYEQKITTCFSVVKEQRHIMAENSSLLGGLISKTQESELLDAMDDRFRIKYQDRYLFYMENEKKRFLYQRLCEEKIKLETTFSLEICGAIARDIADLALFQIEYREIHENDIPKRKKAELAWLFCKSQPIFDILVDPVDVIKYDPQNENLEEPGGISKANILAELERQNLLDQVTFEDYLTYHWPWNYESLTDFDLEKISLGNNILGFVAHRLLLEKYPKKVYPTIPKIPKTSVSASFIGLHNFCLLPVLEKLLTGRNIKVVQMEQAFNYCLNVFKNECVSQYTEKVFVAETELAARKLHFKKTKSNFLVTHTPPKKGSKGKKTKSKKSLSAASGEDTKQFVDKINQTVHYSDDKMVLSDTGELGKLLFECLNLGNEPDEEISTHSLVHYLKSLQLEASGGWVLVNYPETIQQAIVLEEILSKKPVPTVWKEVLEEDEIHSIIDVESRKSTDEIDVRRISKLVPNVKPIIDTDYECFLTAFIEIKSYDGLDSLEGIYNCFRSPANTELLQKFYQAQGCKYSLYYQKLDFSTIKNLGRLILGEYQMPAKSSSEVFTETVNYLEAQFGQSSPGNSIAEKEGEKKKKKKVKKIPRESFSDKKSVKSNKSDKKSKNQKNDKSNKPNKAEKEEIIIELQHEDKETQIPEPESEPEDFEETAGIPKPGEPFWTYATLPIPQYFFKALANLWETLETVYINDMKQLFFRRRTLMDMAQPYNTFANKNVLKYIKRPDTKQMYLRTFQVFYNYFDDDLREDDEVKAELHMRIEEFREKLWEICDRRMQENEAERMRVINDHWAVGTLTDLLNIYIQFLQLEIDRSTGTQQLLADYYTAMSTEAPCKDLPLGDITLKLLNSQENSCDEDYLNSFKEYAGTRLGVVKTAIFNDNESPFVEKLSEVVQQCAEKAKVDFSYCKKALDNLEKQFNNKEKGNDLKKEGKSDKQSKKSSSKSNDEVALPEPAHNMKDHKDLCEEFRAAFQAEFERVNLRLVILKHVFGQDHNEIMMMTASNFHDLHNCIQNRYQNEMEAVDEATLLLKRAVESETKIQSELIFKEDKFFVRLGVHLFESPLPEDYSLPAVEALDSEKFTFEQLHRIADIFLKIAPTGVIAERNFTFLLQDLLVYEGDDGTAPYVPALWTRLSSSMTNRVSKELFGHTPYVDWKDFIIYNTNLGFPTESEVLEMRMQFLNCDPDRNEFIYQYQMSQIKWWFDDQYQWTPLQLQRINELLFKLFKIDAECLNYTALMLAFCKDDSPIMGLTKGLIMATGKCLNTDDNKGSYQLTKRLKHIMHKELQDIIAKIDSSDIKNLELPEDHDVDLISTLKPQSSNSISGEDSERDSSVSTMASSEQSVLPFGGNDGKCQSYKQATFQVEFDVLMAVCTAMVPWIHKTKTCGKYTFHQYVAIVYNNLINEDVPIAFFHQLIQDEKFLELIDSIYKFQIKNPCWIIKDLLNQQNTLNT